MVRYGRTHEQISNDIDADFADIAPLGRFALANPDEVERLRADAPLNDVDFPTVYGGGAAGGIDGLAVMRNLDGDDNEVDLGTCNEVVVIAEGQLHAESRCRSIRRILTRGV